MSDHSLARNAVSTSGSEPRGRRSHLDVALEVAENLLGMTPPDRRRRRHAAETAPPFTAPVPRHELRRGRPATAPDFSTASAQDEVVWLRSALNEKETELLEVRDQHERLLARAQEARANWEAALGSKDRALQQLEATLAAQRCAEATAGECQAIAMSQVDDRRRWKAGTQALQHELAEAHAALAARRLARVHRRLLARDASARKYKGAVRALRARAQQAAAASAAGQAEALSLIWRLDDALHANAELRKELERSRAISGKAAGGGGGASGGCGDLEQAAERLPTRRAQLARLRDRLRDGLTCKAARRQAVEQHLLAALARSAAAETRAAEAEARPRRPPCRAPADARASVSISQAPRPGAKELLSAEGRAAALAAALREREACLASAQAQLLQTEARHAQVEDSLHAELAARGAALADADRRFAELETLLQRLAARADAV
ncbi:hypothetical protein WJX81_000126 [Elliptochloris bilobata]|uniref:Uncharacterized protein n=1 Tax=Elliptochloris bilobata TaxID=381761 RepID=A0AAW1S5S0_9CHLO